MLLVNDLMYVMLQMSNWQCRIARLRLRTVLEFWTNGMSIEATPIVRGHWPG